MPDTNQGYWAPKLARNVERDKQHIRALKRGGWRVLTIWECETGDLLKLLNKMKKFLG